MREQLVRHWEMAGSRYQQFSISAAESLPKGAPGGRSKGLKKTERKEMWGCRRTGKPKGICGTQRAENCSQSSGQDHEQTRRAYHMPDTNAPENTGKGRGRSGRSKGGRQP